MPTYVELMEEALSSNCHRIADLCELREKANNTFNARFSRLRNLEELLEIENARKHALGVIDREIELLSKGSKNLMLRLGAVS